MALRKAFVKRKLTYTTIGQCGRREEGEHAEAKICADNYLLFYLAMLCSNWLCGGQTDRRTDELNDSEIESSSFYWCVCYLFIFAILRLIFTDRLSHVDFHLEAYVVLFSFLFFLKNTA
jgi:hypothetical protein